MISYNSESKIFKLDMGDASYIFGIGQDGILVHYYYGRKLTEDAVAYLVERGPMPGVEAKPAVEPGGLFTMGSTLLEYPCYGIGDYRPEALRIRDAGGHVTTDIHYVSHRIYDGKAPIPGMPSSRGDEGEVMTLEVLCEDRFTKAEIVLVYCVFSDLPVMTRRTVVTNRSDVPLDIERVQSAAIDFNTSDYDLIHLPGRWCRERNITRTPLEMLTKSFGSGRGSSSHFQNPFAALVSREATEEFGEAYGLNLVYSGNFTIDANVDSYSSSRLTIGLGDASFGWHLESGESFYTPEAVMVYSHEGIGGMSRIFHRFYHTHLIAEKWLQTKRPLLINNWEATYFNFDEDKLVAIGEAAHELGIEMLVLDDGWFGHRSNDKSSLGDWFVFEQKLPKGLGSLSDRLHEVGLKFGLWFEPEMVSPDSELYRAHPDWCLHIEGRPMSLGRFQLILDLSRPEVVDYIYESMCQILDSAKIEYIKWDYNRNFTEVGSACLAPERQKEVPHRYMLGLYGLLERLTARYPDLLIEGCASGGGRFDPAMLCYSPQIWTSDDSDAIERLDIQFGTSMCYPVSSMGAHVSASPNHQVGRVTPLTTRGDVALSGSFGYELDAGNFTEDEKEIVKRQVEEYHKYYDLTHGGELYRLIAPHEGKRECAAWMLVSPDKSEALVTFVVIRVHNKERYFVKLRGLDENRRYRNEATGEIFYGSTLMYAGLNFTDLNTDFKSKKIHLVAVED